MKERSRLTRRLPAKLVILTISLVLSAFLFFETIAESSYRVVQDDAWTKIKSDLKVYSTIKSLKPEINEELANEYTEEIRKVADKYEIDPLLITILIYSESSFNVQAKGPKLKSGQKCIGALQIQPNQKLVRDLEIDVKSLTDLSSNLDAGCKILKCKFVVTGNWKDALISYKGGWKSRKEVRKILWLVESLQ